ncbi:unnamed protein product, partial [Ceratitis capitata]
MHNEFMQPATMGLSVQTGRMRLLCAGVCKLGGAVRRVGVQSLTYPPTTFEHSL